LVFRGFSIDSVVEKVSDTPDRAKFSIDPDRQVDGTGSGELNQALFPDNPALVSLFSATNM